MVLEAELIQPLEWGGWRSITPAWLHDARANAFPEVHKGHPLLSPRQFAVHRDDPLLPLTRQFEVHRDDAPLQVLKSKLLRSASAQIEGWEAKYHGIFAVGGLGNQRSGAS